MKKVALTAWIAMWIVPWPVMVEAQESGMDTYDLPEMVVSSARYHGGIIGSTTAVGNMLGEKDTMDVPMNTKAVSKEAFTVFAMPGHELEDGMTVIPTVRRRKFNGGARRRRSYQPAIEAGGADAVDGGRYELRERRQRNGRGGCGPPLRKERGVGDSRERPEPRRDIGTVRGKAGSAQSFYQH